MLKRRMRLRAHEVKEVLAKGSSARGQYLQIKFLRAPGAFCAAVVVAKSVARKATARNRLRRAAYRALALASLPRTGRAVFFVRTIPPSAVQPAFAQEVAALLAKYN